MSMDKHKRLHQLNCKAFYVYELPPEIIEEFGSVPIAEESRQYDHEYEDKS